MNINLILKHAVDTKTELFRMYDEVTKSDIIDEPGEVYLRPSMLPVCGITLYLDMLYYNNRKKFDFTRSYPMSYFCGVGTTVHEVIESFVGETSYKLWGNWECKCGNKWKHSHVKTCKKCGRIATYKEITISWGGFSGHIDCILITKKGILVGDFKTSTFFGMKKDFKKMNVAYSLQILTYCLMLDKVWGDYFKRKYGLRVYGGSLLFLSRDNPFKPREVHFPFNKKLEKMVRLLMAKAQIGMQDAVNAIETGDVSTLIKRRVCKSRLDYESRIKTFYVYEDCRLCSVCHSKKSLESFLRKRELIK